MNANVGTIRMLAAVAVLSMAGCGGGGETEPEAPAPETYSRAEAPTPEPAGRPEIRFVDITRGAGIGFVHEDGWTGEKYMPETMGAGCGLFDYDLDGDLDIFLVNGRKILPGGNGGQRTVCALYRNDGGAKFTDVSESSGLDIEIYGMGCAAGDADGDGDLDLFVTAALDGNRYFANNGDGTFSDATEAAGLTSPVWTDGEGDEHPYWSSSAGFFDYNRDGWLDLFVCNYIQWSIDNDVFTTITGLGKAFTRPDLYKGLSPLLYRNDGDGTFTDVTREAGVWNPEGKSLGLAFEDFNGDGYMDVAVANDAQPDFLFLNQNGESFIETGLSAGIAYDENGRARAGMGIDAANLFNDGKPAIGIGNFSHEPISIYIEEAELFFVEGSGRTRISRPSLLSLTFGLAFFDYDLDGFLDVAAANGHIEPDIQSVEKEVSHAQPPQMFHNVEGRLFEEVTGEMGPDFAKPMVGRGLAHGDIDGDGDIDLLITECGGPPRLLRNGNASEANNWIRFDLQGNGPNRFALGARIILAADGRKQTRRIRGGSSYLSHSEFTAAFGLGKAESLETLAVQWPSGAVQAIPPGELSKFAVNQTHVIEEPAGIGNLDRR